MRLSNLGIHSLLPLLMMASPQALQTTGASGTGSKPRVGATVICADAVTDQEGAGCMQASSTASSGLLFPYPGTGATFMAPAVVAGGSNNTASGSYAFIGGGSENTAAGTHASVCGGGSNYVSGLFATVGGGFSNTTSQAFATIAGGYNNQALGGLATVGGGGGYYGNKASGANATIPGGYNNTASATGTFAAGSFASAIHPGSFVWGDGLSGNKTSSAADEFNVYASGGTRIFSSSAATTGVLLAPGASMWTMVSDRNAKENLEPVDAREVLERVTEIPISTWNYKGQDDGIRHMGPMAQDFYAAFGLGLGDKTIDTIDPGGVALAAIQGLRHEKDEQIAAQATEIAELRQANEQLRAEFEALRAHLASFLE